MQLLFRQFPMNLSQHVDSLQLFYRDANYSKATAGLQGLAPTNPELFSHTGRMAAFAPHCLTPS
jgi:hypothetical protein